MNFGNVPHGLMRQIVRRNLSDYTVSRPTETTGRYGDSDETYATQQERAWLFNPEESNEQTDYGVRLEGSLQGLALPSADLQVHDRLDHDGDTHEILDIQHVNSNSDKTLKRIGLEKIQV